MDSQRSDLPDLGTPKNSEFSNLGGPKPDGLSQLGSLAQGARLKKLNSARNILIIIGILVIVGAAAFMVIIPAQAQGNIPEAQLRAFYLVNFALMGLGVVFFVLAFFVKQYPVPITVVSLILYLGYQALLVADDIQNLWRGIIIKVIIIAALVKAVQAAMAYQKEEDAAKAAAEQGL